MTRAEIWSALGIAPTSDLAAVRLAYAERLKQVRPDRDPEGFRTLREAFEAARRLTRATAPATAPDMPRPGPPRESAAPAEPPPASAAPAIRRHLAERQIHRAALAWHHAARAGELSFDEEPALQAEIAKAVVALEHVELAELRETARLMQWEEAAVALRTAPVIVDAVARLGAEAWFERLTRAAGEGWRWSRAARRRNRAARLLLKGPPGPVRRLFPYVLRAIALEYWLGPLAAHRRWLGARIHPARVAWCVASRRRFDARFVSVMYYLIGRAMMVATFTAVVVAIVVSVGTK